MGASGWDYTVPYQDDVSAALQALRAASYESGDYYHSIEDESVEVTDADSLLDSQPESGTHSIIDMYCGVAPTPEDFTVSPLTPSQILDTFGTPFPTAEQVRAWADGPGIADLRQRWQGAYLVSFDSDARPTRLHFVGFSGD